MRLRDQLLVISETYARAVGRSEARISTIVYGSGNAISRLRDGADMGSERLHNGLQWFSDHWPADAVWPNDVPRPDLYPPPAARIPDAPPSTTEGKAA